MSGIICPSCKTQMAYVPELAGQLIQCPKCGQRMQSPVLHTAGVASFPPPPPTALDYKAASPDESEAPRYSTPSFRLREYPAMRFIVTVLYVLAGLAVASFLLSTALVFIMFGEAVYNAFSGKGDNSGALMMGSAMMIVSSLLFHGSFVIAFVASAEAIRVSLDIQRNTQETAFHMRHLRLATER